MLHKLALAVNDDQATLEKLALPSAQKQKEQVARLQEKQRALMEARGIPTPLEVRPVYDNHGNVVGQTLEENLDTARASRRVRGKASKPAGVPAPSGKATSPLIEKGIIEAGGEVSNSPMKRFKHRTVAPAKRFWAGQGGLGGKWKNRLALLAGAGALAGGAKLLGASRGREQFNEQSESVAKRPGTSQGIPQRLLLEAAQRHPQYAQLQQQQYQQAPQGMLYGYKQSAVGSYVQDAANIPAPPSQPKVPSPGPSIGAPSVGGGVKGIGMPTGTGGATGGGTNIGGGSKTAEDGTLPLAAGGVGGLGGYALGKKVLSPALEYQEKGIANRIQAMQRLQAGLSTAKQNAPMAAAVAGAILLAALTAVKARDKNVKVGPDLQGADPTNAGFAPHERMQYGSPNGGFYG